MAHIPHVWFNSGIFSKGGITSYSVGLKTKTTGGWMIFRVPTLFVILVLVQNLK